jgi:hypothetical protein
MFGKNAIRMTRIAAVAAAATVLLSGNVNPAAASPVPPTGVADTASVKPGVIHFPDIAVTANGKQFGYQDVVVYHFQVSNPSQVAIQTSKAKRFHGLRYQSNGDWAKWSEPKYSFVNNLQPGETRGFDVSCDPEPGTYCSSAVVEIEPIQGEIVRNNNIAAQE